MDAFQCCIQLRTSVLTLPEKNLKKAFSRMPSFLLDEGQGASVLPRMSCQFCRECSPVGRALRQEPQQIVTGEYADRLAIIDHHHRVTFSEGLGCGAHQRAGTEQR